MSFRQYLAIGGLIVSGSLCGGCSADSETGDLPPTGDAARRVHDQVIALDTHVDIPLDFATEGVDPLSADLQVNLNKMRAGGLDAAFFIVYVGQSERTAENYEQAQADALTKFAAIHRMTDDLYPDRVGLAYRADDVTRLIGEGRLAAAIGIENGFVLGTDLSMLDRYYALGARYVSLVHNGHNDLGDSAQPQIRLGDAPTEHGGLSDFGKRVIMRMNELGIMVDISHASKQTALAAIAQSRAPVIASHSGVAGVARHARNLDDETLLALESSSGVVQIVAFETYVLEQPPERAAALQALAESVGLDRPADPSTLPDTQRSPYLRGLDEINAQWPLASIAEFVDHIDYAVELIGVDHVGISSDFGGGGGISGWNGADETFNVTAELLARGYSTADIAKIWSGNLLRVWKEVERVAAGE